MKKSTLLLDVELQKDGWNLQINRHYDEWKALYVNQCHIPASGKGATADEAVIEAYRKVVENAGN